MVSRSEHDALREKLLTLEKKILVGGENLLEKVEVQEQLLEASARELEQRRCKEEQLRQALQQKEVQYHIALFLHSCELHIMPFFGGSGYEL